MSTADLREKIRQLNRIDLEQADYKYLVSQFRWAIEGITVTIDSAINIESYFRARICNTKELQNVSELGAPPPELVTGYQRCNPPGVPMFYAASKRINALLECDVQKGDIVFLGQWMNESRTPLNRVLIPASDAKTFSVRSRDVVFYTYLDTLFHRRIDQAFSNEYKITAAASEVLTTRMPTTSTLCIDDDETVGLVYPSVANICGGCNTAFHASFAAKRLKLLHVTKLRISERSQRDLIIEILDTAHQFKDGSIVWLGSNFAVPKPIRERGSLEFVARGGEWILSLLDEPLNPEAIHVFLHE